MKHEWIKPISFSIIIIMIFLLSGHIALANSPPLHMQGSTAFPMNSDFIVLEKETIQIHFGKDTHQVEVMFYFYNTGPETDLQIGFPNVANYGEALREFHAYDYPDMKPYSVQKKAGGVLPGLDQYMYNSMFAWTMHFDEEERKALRVTYSFNNTRMGEEDGGLADYILEAGALWKGNIENIDIFVHFPEKVACQEINALPANYIYNGKGIECQF